MAGSNGGGGIIRVLNGAVEKWLAAGEGFGGSCEEQHSVEKRMLGHKVLAGTARLDMRLCVVW